MSLPLDSHWFGFGPIQDHKGGFKARRGLQLEHDPDVTHGFLEKLHFFRFVFDVEQCPGISLEPHTAQHLEQVFFYLVRKKDSRNLVQGEILEPILLYAEDDGNDVILAEMVLAHSQPDLRVHVVRDGRQAIAYVRREGTFSDPQSSPKPSLVLLDVKMPKMSGMEALQAIRMEVELKDVPIVLISSSMQEVDVLRAYELGANAYLAKPAGFRKFESVLSKAVDFFLNCSCRRVQTKT